MATTISCDMCEEVISSQVYSLKLGDFTADLCMACAAGVQSFVEKGAE